MMHISELQITPVKPSDGLVGFASFVLNNELYLGSIGIHTRLDGSGYRLTFPTKKVGEQNLHIFHPINKEAASYLETLISQHFEEVMQSNHDRHYRSYSPAL